MSRNEADAPYFQPDWTRRARAALKRWYLVHGRELPWRAAADPYRIWISEIMLQQTTVAAVIPYFERFLSRFPDVRALAVAAESDVLKLWEGLGYYSRARNLHRAAQKVCETHRGEFPRTADELQRLPGIGRYTAGAIASFAFNAPAPIVEANTRRLYSRLIGLTEDPASSTGQQALWSFAASIIGGPQPALFNQALMDLGSLVCRPVDPACDACPLNAVCNARATDRQHLIPVPRARPEVTVLSEVCVAIQRQDRWLLRQRTDDERWAGLWDFPRLPALDSEVLELSLPSGGWNAGSRKALRTLFDELETDSTPAWLMQRIVEQCGLSIGAYRGIGLIRHAVTRYRIRLHCVQAMRAVGAVRRESGFVWIPTGSLTELPMSRTGRQFATALLQLPRP